MRQLSYKSNYDNDLDQKVVDLCNALNSLPGIKTKGSCCGHGKGPLRIYFQVDATHDSRLQGLFFFTRCADRRYWGHGYDWSIELSVSDKPKHPLPTTFILTSARGWGGGKTTVGKEAYDQAIDLVRNMNDHLNHEAFMNGFSLDVEKFTFE